MGQAEVVEEERPAGRSSRKRRLSSEGRERERERENTTNAAPASQRVIP